MITSIGSNSVPVLGQENSVIKQTVQLTLLNNCMKQSCSAMNKFSVFMKSEGSLSCSQEPVTGPYPGLTESSTQPLSLKLILIFKKNGKAIPVTGRGGL
jgi:hypothetical protein